MAQRRNRDVEGWEALRMAYDTNLARTRCGRGRNGCWGERGALVHPSSMHPPVMVMLMMMMTMMMMMMSLCHPWCHEWYWLVVPTVRWWHTKVAVSFVLSTQRQGSVTKRVGKMVLSTVGGEGGSPVSTRDRARVVGTCSACIASDTRNSRTLDRSTALPSKLRLKGDRPQPFNCNS